MWYCDKQGRIKNSILVWEYMYYHIRNKDAQIQKVRKETLEHKTKLRPT